MENASAYYVVFDYLEDPCMPFHESYLYRLTTYHTSAPYQNSETKRQNVQLPLRIRDPFFRFCRDKYPVCMGCAALGSTFYFLGGYTLPEGDAKKYADRQYSDMLYILDTTLIGATDTAGQIEDKIQTQKLDVKKSRPVVITVGDRLYVLPCNFGETYDGPSSIQSYDLHSKRQDSALIGITESHSEAYDLRYDLVAYYVKGHEIIIVLDAGIYSFNSKDMELRPIGKQQHSFGGGPPFVGLGACVDDGVFGLDQRKQYVLSYKIFPSALPIKDTTTELVHHARLSQFRRRSISYGHLMPVEDAAGNKLVVIRSGRRIGDATIFFAFDFFHIVKDANGRPRCHATLSTVHFSDSQDRVWYTPIACLPIEQINEMQVTPAPEIIPSQFKRGKGKAQYKIRIRRLEIYVPTKGRA